MIGKLTGLLDSFGAEGVIVDVGGVGYLVQVSARTLAALPARGEPVSLYIETQMREDRIQLIGFAGEAEREWFRLLLAVPGVGNRLALGVLGTLKPAELASAVALGDRGAVARSPGVGPKMAQRILTELKDKVPAFGGAESGHVALRDALGEARAPRPVADAVSALVNLGYPEVQASGAIAAALGAAGEDATTETLIRLGLKELAR